MAWYRIQPGGRPWRLHRTDNVDGSEAEAARYQAAFCGIARERWQLFDTPDEISASDLISDR